MVQVEEQSIGHEEQSIGHEKQSVGHEKQSIGHEKQSIGHEKQSIGHEEQSIGHEEQSIGLKEQSVRHEEQSIGHEEQSVRLELHLVDVAPRCGVPLRPGEPRPMRVPASIAIAIALAGVALASPSIVGAEPIGHHGFMARLGLGIGYLNASESTVVGDVSVSGPAITDHVALGGYIVPGFALHGTFWQNVAFNPSVSAGSLSVTTSDASLSQAAVGIGATYFITPADSYLSASLGVGTLSASYSRGGTTTTSQTQAGFALNVIVGKQWNVGGDWGLGVSGQFSFQSNSDHTGSTSYDITTLGFGLLFSATYH